MRRGTPRRSEQNQSFDEEIGKIPEQLLPANLCFGVSLLLVFLGFGLMHIRFLVLFGLLFFVLGVFTLPGCMTVYACEEDPRVLRQPVRAFKRACEHRRLYLKAWLIALASIVISFLGLLLFIVGFFFTSVWAWEVVGYAFTVAMYSQPQMDPE